MKKNQQYRSRKSWGRVDRGDAHRDRRGCRSSASVTEIWLEWRSGGEGFGVNGGGARTRRPAVVPASVADVLADAGRVVSSGDSRCGELDADGSDLQATGSNSWQRNLSMVLGLERPARNSKSRHGVRGGGGRIWTPTTSRRDGVRRSWPVEDGRGSISGGGRLTPATRRYSSSRERKSVEKI
ncbi:hypothetical protein M6B38_254225 [Iris pallida]|uniref:Uncharacterized protein n=1 Tax=Iris pallida TaxID=29817 RepID=A0AAX6IJL8_IRIPA|nr:hypothetical protein M6B38_254225 [Iris pallida]